MRGCRASVVSGGKLAELTGKGGERYGEGACRGRPQAAADRGVVRRDRRSGAQEAPSWPLPSVHDRLHSEMPDHRRVARRARRRGLPRDRPRGGVRPSRPQAPQGGLAGVRGDARLCADVGGRRRPQGRGREGRASLRRRKRACPLYERAAERRSVGGQDAF